LWRPHVSILLLYSPPPPSARGSQNRSTVLVRPYISWEWNRSVIIVILHCHELKFSSAITGRVSKHLAPPAPLLPQYYRIRSNLHGIGGGHIIILGYFLFCSYFVEPAFALPRYKVGVHVGGTPSPTHSHLSPASPNNMHLPSLVPIDRYGRCLQTTVHNLSGATPSPMQLVRKPMPALLMP
jgi:hypothetical protein